MSVDAVPGVSATSYVSNADAIIVWQNDPYKQDFPTVEADQDRALITATQMLDDVYGDQYKGIIYNTTYALFWPRTGVIDHRTGLLITDFAAFPVDIARATALQAYHVNKNNRQEESADRVSTNVREKLDGVGEIERADTSDQRSATDRPAIHPEVSRIMSRWVTGGSSQYSSVMSRG